MNLPRFFVDRPIFAAVLSIVITLLGALAYLALPVAQYPDVAPPTVIVTATYPGADAQTLAETVSTPLEQEINGVERMLYMSSSSTSDGKVQITITFELGTDLDRAQVLVQNRVNTTLPRLPEDVRRSGITAKKQSPDLTLAAQFFSPDGSRDIAYLANYVTLQVRDRISRIKGVADANSLGGQDFTMRIWLDPEKMAARNLTAGDLTRALREQNLQIAGGSLGQPPTPSGVDFQYTLVAQGRLLTTEEFGNVVVKSGAEGDVTRVRDVARVELGARDYASKTYMDGFNAVSLRVFQLSRFGRHAQKFPARRGLPNQLRSDAIHPRFHGSRFAHAHRSNLARGNCRGGFSANLARFDYPAVGGAGFIGWHTRGNEAFRFLT
jgi:multidrug efflux pump subunit AcrB